MVTKDQYCDQSNYNIRGVQDKTRNKRASGNKETKMSPLKSLEKIKIATIELLLSQLLTFEHHVLKT